MTKYPLLCLSLLLISFNVFAAGNPGKPWSATEAGTQAIPTTDASLGMSLADVSHYRVSVCLTTGTLAGGELLVPYYFSAPQGKWVPIHSRVLTVTAASGVALGSCFGWAETNFIMVPTGRIYYATSGFAAATKVVIEPWLMPLVTALTP